MPELLHPAWLLLLPLPWLLARWRAPAPGSARALRLPADWQPGGSAGPSHARDAGRPARIRLPVAAAWLLLLLAAAQPVVLGEPLMQQTHARDLLLAVDLSGSMRAQDMVIDGRPVDRLTAVKHVMGEFIERRAGDRIGLLLFGEQPFLVTPLTTDRHTVRVQLEEALIGMAGNGTAIGDAIGLAWKRLAGRDSARKVVVLVSDGANTAGNLMPDEAIARINDASFVLYTIGIGAERMVVPGLFGNREVNPSADLDEAQLRRLAEATGGRYFRARDSAGLRAIHAELDRLEPVAGESLPVTPQRHLFHWPLALAVLLLAASGLHAQWQRRQGEAAA